MNTDTLNDRTEIIIGKKYGCLQVLDDGDEYKQNINEKISSINMEKEDFIEGVKIGKFQRKDWHGWNGDKTVITPAYIYTPVNFTVYGHSVTVSDFDKEVAQLLTNIKVTHYKCKCLKCGKIRYYSAKTLQIQPKVCYKPMYCSSNLTYSTRANNANYNKRMKYANDESVCFVSEKGAVIPSKEYCDSWNNKRKKELIKQAEKDAQIIAAIPRKPAKNYNINYVGETYESLEILECVNDSLESVPIPYYNQRHQKLYRDITVYKEYRCRCYLCGREQMVTCDKFGIYPPTEYGYRAYNGYWSEVFCDCHPISSFQWIVNDILIKHGVKYRVEVSPDGVYGIDNATHLRYDFAIYKESEIIAFIECQGEQHFMPIAEFGGERRFAIQRRNDEEKRKYAKSKNIKLVEISYKNKKYEKIETILMNEHII